MIFGQVPTLRCDDSFQVEVSLFISQILLPTKPIALLSSSQHQLPGEPKPGQEIADGTGIKVCCCCFCFD